MAYMTVDPIEGQRGVIRRAAEELSRRAGDFLDPSEDCRYFFEQNLLALRVGIRSIRARQLLTSFEKSIFRGFQAHRFEYKNGMVWARFGFSDF